MGRVGLRSGWWRAALWCATGLTLLGLGAGSAAAQEQQQQNQSADKSATNDTTAANNPAPAKPASKAKHVITNDDIKPSPYASFGGLFYFSTGSINDCDSSCFDQLHLMGGLNSDKNPNWRTQILRELDAVRSNSEWQTYLRVLYTAHNKICQLTFDKQDELRRSGSARNVGPQEIAIDEKYDEQTKAAQAALNGEVARQSLEQKIFSDKPYANAFATMQGTRMMGGFCTQGKVIYPTIIR